MTAPHSERFLTLGKGRQLPGSPGRRTLREWMKKGCKSQVTGETVLLEGWQIGGRWHTSVEAFDRFLAKLNGEKL